MNKPKFIFLIAFFFLSSLPLASSAQIVPKPLPPAEPSFDVVLQTLVASNNATERTSLPSTLSGVVKKLRANYSFSDYRLTSTYLQRVANTGNLEFKSTSGGTASGQDIYTPTFTDWSFNELRTGSSSGESNIFQLQNFRFGQRIPIKTGSYKNESKEVNAVINYENTGLSMQRLYLRENTPTVIGTLSTSSPGELSFLVLTIKNAE